MNKYKCNACDFNCQLTTKKSIEDFDIHFCPISVFGEPEWKQQKSETDMAKNNTDNSQS